MKIFFIVPYPLDEAPSQRFRFEQYLPLLTDSKYYYKTESFFSKPVWDVVYQPGKILPKICYVLWGFVKRYLLLFKILGYDFIFIHRESTPFGPPIIEWMIAKVLKKKIIYDFDDAIWTTDKRHESSLEKIIRCRKKVSLICRWSYKVSCGNQFLCEYARTYNNSVVLNPTTIDLSKIESYAYPSINNNEVIIGWTGSHSTLKYLSAIENVLKLIEQKYPFVKFLVIANRKPALSLKALLYLPWTKTTEVDDLRRIDIGIMPLPDDEWSQGKCGFKALQYMALGIPPVISPVGVNKEIVSHGEDGFLCATHQEWKTTLEFLIQNPAVRKSTGEKARLKVIDNYSVSSNATNFLSLFQ